MVVEIFLLFAFASMVFWGIGDFLIQRTVRRIGDVEALFFIGIIGVIGLLPFVLLDLALLFAPENLAVLVLLGIITFIAAIFDFEALKQGKISVIEVILELELPITVVLGYIFFGEFLSTVQLFLIIPIFAGIILMALKSIELKKIKLMRGFEKGVVLAIFGAIGMAFINSITAVSARQVSPLMAVWFPWLIFTLICLFVLIKNKKLKNLLQNAKKQTTLILFMGIFDTLAWIAYAFATSTYNIGVITAITESYPAIGIVLGILINKEKVAHHQFLGAALTLIACLFLALSV